MSDAYEVTEYLEKARDVWPSPRSENRAKDMSTESPPFSEREQREQQQVSGSKQNKRPGNIHRKLCCFHRTDEGEEIDSRGPNGRRKVL